jgi:uncharacterized membrane protein HdeD (DUF308 family)
MVKSIKTNWWLLLLVGIIFLILAVKVMMHPAESIIELAFFIGWASLIAGVFQVGYYLSSKSIIQNWAWGLFGGVINIIIGIIFLSHPAITAQILPFFVGFWMIFIGITTFFNGIREQNNNMPAGWFDMLLGVLIFIGGLWISYNPVAEAAMLIWLISFTLMFYGIYFVVISIQLSKIK